MRGKDDIDDHGHQSNKSHRARSFLAFRFGVSLIIWSLLNFWFWFWFWFAGLMKLFARIQTGTAPARATGQHPCGRREHGMRASPSAYLHLAFA